MQADSQQIPQLDLKKPITRLYESLYIPFLKLKLLLVLLPFSTKLGIVILEEKTKISETKIRISMIATILILCFGLFSSDLHVFIPGNTVPPNTQQIQVEAPVVNTTSEPVVEEEVPISDESLPSPEQQALLQRLSNYSKENNLIIETIPESREEQILQFEQYESYLQRNPGTPIIYLNAAILAFSLEYENLGTFYLDQAILLNPDLKEIVN